MEPAFPRLRKERAGGKRLNTGFRAGASGGNAANVQTIREMGVEGVEAGLKDESGGVLLHQSGIKGIDSNLPANFPPLYGGAIHSVASGTPVC